MVRISADADADADIRPITNIYIYIYILLLIWNQKEVPSRLTSQGINIIDKFLIGRILKLSKALFSGKVFFL